MQIPYRILKKELLKSSPFLLVCDHAGAKLPEEFAGCGLSAEDLSRHISHDIGAAEVTEILSETLPAAAILASFSRLIVDLNRDSACPDAIPETSDGTDLPFNHNLSEAQRAARFLKYHLPYHMELGSLAQTLKEAHGANALGVLVHSFTPQMKDGAPRPWHIGLLWRDDPATAETLKAWLETRTEYAIGNNEPYSGFSEASYSMRKHFGEPGTPHIAIEIRQDLIRDAAGQKKIAGILTAALKALRMDD